MQVCTPTIEKDCHTVTLKSRSLETRESCVAVVRTVCEEEEETVDNEVCYYVYNQESEDTEAASVTVDYEEQCEQETVRSCPPAAAYGHSGYCKGEAAEVCYNVPRVRPAQTSVTVTYPVAERKCENKPVKVPKMQCREVEVSSSASKSCIRISSEGS